MKRHPAGQSLVEAMIAVGLSGTLVIMLSGMLAQTLLIATTSQNELIAAHAAEELLENARIMTYDEISNLVLEGKITKNVPIFLEINADGSMTPPLIRPTPVQLNLLDSSTVYGEINPSATTVINPFRRWIPGVGNFFKGAATEIVTDIPSGYAINVVVSYDATYATSTQNSRKLSRTVYVMQGGLDFR